MRSIPLFVALACFFLPSTAHAEQLPLPPSPEGFEWRRCDQTEVTVLQPAGWHYRHMMLNDTQAYFITKDKFNPPELFLTGMTINVVSDVSKKHRTTAFVQGAAFIGRMMKESPYVIEALLPGMRGPFKTMGCRVFRDGSNVHYFMVADDASDKLYVFFFEAPKDEWEQSWKVGEQMMRQLQINFVLKDR